MPRTLNPFFSGQKETKIIDVIASPESHLMIGADNILFRRMVIQFEDVRLNWAMKCNIVRETTDASHTFAGKFAKYSWIKYIQMQYWLSKIC